MFRGGRGSSFSSCVALDIHHHTQQRAGSAINKQITGNGDGPIDNFTGESEGK